MTCEALAHDIQSRLQLETPPVALSFANEAPPNVRSQEEAVPSACALWRQAEKEVFYADASAHLNCPIGAMVMGFELPADAQAQLMSVVERMTGCGYLGAEEVAHIPMVKRQKAGIVYGPLEKFPGTPDVALLWLSPRQAMLAAEAIKTCSWADMTPTTAMGRPACAAIPISLDRTQATLSLGCTGMRTYTEISDDRLLIAIPGGKLQEFSDSLRTTIEANDAMQTFYWEQKARFSPPLN
ncbi:MAG: DUF169 domain-containing protein [Armatimonadota bacterium]|nr:DUF169 domain-containing protein [Armatimonadota bacterium]